MVVQIETFAITSNSIFFWATTFKLFSCSELHKNHLLSHFLQAFEQQKFVNQNQNQNIDLQSHFLQAFEQQASQPPHQQPSPQSLSPVDKSGREFSKIRIFWGKNIIKYIFTYINKYFQK